MLATRPIPPWAQHAKPSDERTIERLVPIAQDLAQRAGFRGITVRQLRGAGVAAGVLTGQEMPSALRFLPVVMHRAGLSRGRGAHRQSVYRLLTPLVEHSHVS